MTPERVRGALALAVAAVILAAVGCDRAESRPPPPVCGPAQVAEWDDDGWECEPDKNRNGVDDEEDRRRRVGTRR